MKVNRIEMVRNAMAKDTNSPLPLANPQMDNNTSKDQRWREDRRVGWAVVLLGFVAFGTAFLMAR